MATVMEWLGRVAPFPLTLRMRLQMPKTKTVKLDVGVWFNEKSGHIHIAAKDAFISTVSNDPDSKRYHPNLYRKLAQVLKDKASSHP
ncbi:MAG: hypothetical protein SH849_09065 [Terricaulis sp.]|nr:hypothetical protein [Terricaulis sp.]